VPPWDRLSTCGRIVGFLLTCLVLPALAVADSPDPDSSADSLDVAAEWLESGRFAEVDALIRRLLPQLEQQYGPVSDEVARAHDHLVTALWRTGRGQAPETLERARKAVALKEEVHGPDHLEVSESLFNLGILMAMGGNHASADSLFARVLAIREAALPPDHPDLAAAINALANVRHFAADYEGALTLYRRALEVMEPSAGPSGEETYFIRTSIAQALGRLGRFDEAQEMLEQLIELQVAQDHPHLPRSLNLLANQLSFSAEHSDARDLYRQALPLAEAQGGPLAPWAVVIRANLVSELARLGEYSEARALIEDQIERLESESLETTALAKAYGMLANVLSSLGDDEAALPLRQRSLELLEQLLPPGHPDTGEAMLNLAGTLGRLGRVDEQKDLIASGVAIYTEHFDSDSPDLLRFLDGLGEILYERGDLAQAQQTLERALHLRERAFGVDSPGLPQNLASLARIARAVGESQNARAYLDRAVTLSTRHIGPDHPITAAYQMSLAWAEFDTGDHDTAIARAIAAERVLTPNLRLTLQALPERQALGYAGRRAHRVDLFLRFLDVVSDPTLVDAAWDAVIRTRALVQDEMAARTRRWTTDDPDHQMRLSAHRRASTRLANLYVRGPGDEEPEIYRALLDEARREMEKAELALAEGESNRASEIPDRVTGLAEIESAIPEGSALLAYTRYRERPSGPGDRGQGTERYRAMICASSSSAAVSVNLGDAKIIDHLIETWREEMSTGLFEGGRQPDEATEICNLVGLALRAVIWDPVADHLEGAQTVFVVPDGQIHLINTSALPTDTGTYLIEDGPLIHHLSAERDLVRMREDRQVLASALVMGAPDFGVTAHVQPTSRPTPVVDDQDPRGLGLFRDARPAGLDLLPAEFKPLPGSLREAQEVAHFWRGRLETRNSSDNREAILLLTGSSAREETFKRLAPGRSVLHLATHGFVLEDVPEAGNAMRGTNPLLLSGLALAGANQRSELGPEQEDGILTAQEIASLDLSATRWAVLSACDTGTGTVQKGEGVLGLRRAFHVAGVNTLISSLWAVQDDETLLWMEAFYRGIAEDRLGTAEAVRSAGLSVLRGLREQGKDTHPFHWAAFLASGDWR
jgi:CHAT domain-containing protein/tetratricopeptide (TPR) repeat protein